MQKIIRITYDLMVGLTFFHERNIIHRDISANNVLVHVEMTKNGEGVVDPSIYKVVLADFDNCRYFPLNTDPVGFRPEAQMHLTKAEQMGKYHYRPPEGVHRPRMYDQKWD